MSKIATFIVNLVKWNNFRGSLLEVSIYCISRLFRKSLVQTEKCFAVFYSLYFRLVILWLLWIFELGYFVLALDIWTWLFFYCFGYSSLLFKAFMCFEIGWTICACFLMVLLTFWCCQRGRETHVRGKGYIFSKKY